MTSAPTAPFPFSLSPAPFPTVLADGEALGTLLDDDVVLSLSLMGGVAEVGEEDGADVVVLEACVRVLVEWLQGERRWWESP